MSRQIKHFHDFGCFRLDATERALLRDGELEMLTPKAFEALLALVEERGRRPTSSEMKTAR